MSYILLDYECPRCGLVTESLERRARPSRRIKCQCGARAERVISGTHAGTVWGAAAVRGKSDERPGPATLDTRAIADGMPVHEWKKRRAKMWQDRGRAEAKSKGLTG